MLYQTRLTRDTSIINRSWIKKYIFRFGLLLVNCSFGLLEGGKEKVETCLLSSEK